MSLIKEPLYSLADISIIPAVLTSIESRSECDVRYEDGLPIFLAPMSCVTNEHNLYDYENYDWPKNSVTNIGDSNEKKRMIKNDNDKIEEKNEGKNKKEKKKEERNDVKEKFDQILFYFIYIYITNHML